MKRVFLCCLLCLTGFANHVGEDHNQFALSLFSKLEDREDNLAFSPYSIFQNLSLLYAGAADHTKKQIKSVLHINGPIKPFFEALSKHREGLTHNTKGGYAFHVANGIFLHQGTHILKNYQATAEKIFDAQVEPVDFSQKVTALSTINDWVSEKTKGTIKTLISESDIGQMTRMIPISAVYFDGKWSKPFHQSTMTTKAFRPEGGESYSLKMLSQTNAFPYFENATVQCLGLPLIREGQNQPYIECFLVLPKMGSLEALEKHLTTDTLDSWFFSTHMREVSAMVPPFCFSQKLPLKAPLVSLGMKDPFTYQANFSLIDGVQDLFLQDVVHETYFSFHADGVTASGATASPIGVTSTPPPSKKPICFTADHPFLFFLVDYHSRAILFMGRVADPKRGSCHAS